MFGNFIEYHITDRCNINCKACLHFCPLSNDVKDKNIFEIKYDFLLLKQLENTFNELHILGGEPFLHKDLIEICQYIRKLFPNKYIIIITNGTVLPSEDNIEIFKKLDIKIQVSFYPFRKDWKEYYQIYIQKIKDIIVNTDDINRLTENDITFLVRPCINYKQNYTDEQIEECRMRYCTQLSDGKLYLCPNCAYFKYFDNYFYGQHDIINTYQNNIDYYDLTDEYVSEETFYNWIYHSKPTLCYYCKECNRWFNDEDIELEKWERSKRDINEWLEY